MVRLGLAVAVLLLLAGCSGRKHNRNAAHRGFYYWQTGAGRFRWDDSTYRALHIDRLFVRAFDVDWSDDAAAPVPIAPLDFQDIAWEDSATLVPVVFITNEVFTHLDSTGIKQLAANIRRKLQAGLNPYWSAKAYRAANKEVTEIAASGPYRQKSQHFHQQAEQDSILMQGWKSLQGIQFDCDWTKSTRNSYFAFLRECRKLFPGKQLSATIRLYPYKYPTEAGVPPVDRGMLMCYNAGDVKDLKTYNSIFDRKDIMSYLNSAGHYPLPLDYALPTFEWAVLYRDSTFRSLLPAQSLKDHHTAYLTWKTNTRAVVNHDFVLGYNSRSPLLRVGDIIRFEQPDIKDVEHIATWLSAHKNNKEATLSFYHLNDHDLQKYAAPLDTMFCTF